MYNQGYIFFLNLKTNRRKVTLWSYKKKKKFTMAGTVPVHSSFLLVRERFASMLNALIFMKIFFDTGGLEPVNRPLLFFVQLMEVNTDSTHLGTGSTPSAQGESFFFSIMLNFKVVVFTRQ